MNFIRSLSFAVFFLCSLHTPARSTEPVLISVTIDHMGSQQVVLEWLKYGDDIITRDSAIADEKGHFSFTVNIAAEGLYRLRLADGNAILLAVKPGEHIMVDADQNHLYDYIISGSDGSKELKTFVNKLRDFLTDYNTMAAVIDTFGTHGNDSMQHVAQKELERVKDRFTNYVKGFADTTHYVPNFFFAARILNPEAEAQFIQHLAQSMDHRFPKTPVNVEAKKFLLQHSKQQKK